MGVWLGKCPDGLFPLGITKALLQVDLGINKGAFHAGWGGAGESLKKPA